ncbi:MAG: penicillin-binding transpeptidase domain-containing protein [Candidatus Acidiferrum sp.]|jgi:cell division protein FtsI/penicillin-binding protein 2
MGAIADQKNAGHFLLLLFLGFLAAPSFGRQSEPKSSATRSLFAQSAVEILQRNYAGSETSYLLLDARSGAVLASHWKNSDQPIPLGSLVKPFTALAYAGEHDFRYPIYECKGKASGCWQPQPHGKLDVISAVAVSCNTYFRLLAESVSPEQLASLVQSFGLESPGAESTAANFMGLGARWRISPLHMARAYLELYRRKDQPGVSPLIEGMRQSALHGTGAAIGHQLKQTTALVKTGTAPCTHASWAPADGFVLALVPAEQPEILLFLRIHSVTGAKAAETAGRMLRQMEE